MSGYDDVQLAWARLSRDGHVGMSDAILIVAAVANGDDGRRALADILSRDENVAIVDPDALSYLRISRDLPLPPGVEDHRADAFFRTRAYTGTRLSRTHGVVNPREFLYFNFAIILLTGTLDDVAGVREQMRGSGYAPVTVRMPDGREKAIGIVMVNDFRDCTFGPYKEVIFMVTAVPEESRPILKVVEYVNAFSLQVPLDRGATTYVLKLWLNELGPIDGGNDYLGTNKAVGCFRFEDREDGKCEFRSWDNELKALVSGAVPRTVAPDVAKSVMVMYSAAAQHAGSTVPESRIATIPVASRPDDDRGPACKWAFSVDWRQAVVQPITQNQIGLTFGDALWANRFAHFGYTPLISFYAPSGVGQIVQHIGDCPYNPAGLGV